MKFVEHVTLFLFASRIYNYAFKSHIGILSIFSSILCYRFTFYVAHKEATMPFSLCRIQSLNKETLKYESKNRCFGSTVASLENMVLSRLFDASSISPSKTINIQSGW